MLPASAREHPPALVGKQARELLHQPGLADAGLARDQEQAASASRRSTSTAESLRQLTETPDEGPRRLTGSAAAKPATAGRLTLLASAIRKV